jgi:hypothetical protein
MQHEGPRYCTIGEPMTLCVSTSTATSREMPLFLGQQHAFAEREHLHGEAQVVRDLDRQRQAVVADVCDLRADVVEDRFDPIEGRASRPPSRSTCRVEGRHAPGHWRVNHVGALRADLLATSRLIAGLTCCCRRSPCLAEAGKKAIRATGTRRATFESVTITKITSAVSATAAASRPLHPASISHCAFERVRL